MTDLHNHKIISKKKTVFKCGSSNAYQYGRPMRCRNQLKLAYVKDTSSFMMTSVFMNNTYRNPLLNIRPVRVNY